MYLATRVGANNLKKRIVLPGFKDYVRYLYYVDSRLWSPKALSAEFDISVKSIENIIWQRPSKMSLTDRRSGRDRRNKNLG